MSTPDPPAAGAPVADAEIRILAALGRLALGEDEIVRLGRDLGAILGYVEALRTVNVEGVEPMTHAVPFDCPLRDDVPEVSLAVDLALANAPRRQEGFFQVPRVLPGPGGASSDDAP